jgi:hypothetical protein
MRNSLSYRRIALSFCFLTTCCSASLVGNRHAQTSSQATTILNREQAGPLLPPSVFYKGQVAPIQTRNSAGLRFPDSTLALAALVDTSGYSSAVQQTYQGYLILEKALQIGDKTLLPGAYGFGFVSGDRMVVMDIGGSEVLGTSTVRDPGLQRPNPLQILPDPASSARFRLYLGRSYVTIEASK